MRYTTRIIVPPRIRRSGLPGTPGGAYGPQVLGVRKTFGFGDRLGVATPGHLAAALACPEFAPVFAQQSARELVLTSRTPADVVASAARAVSAARFRQPWGANADRLTTAQEVADAAGAGNTLFTFDPSEFVRPGVDALDSSELQSAVAAFVMEGDLPEDWAEPYLDRTIALPGSHQLRVAREPLQRAVVRYAPAVLHCARLSSALARSNQGRPFEVEVALDRVDAPTTTLEHLFIGLELEARGVRLTSLALTHAGASDPVSPEEWAAQLREHAAVAEFCGPYKLSFDEAVCDPAWYPLIGRVCGEALHVKTSASSYLEALRVVARVEPGLFREIASYSVAGMSADQAERGSTLQKEREPGLAELPAGKEESWFLDTPPGRRCLEAGFVRVLTEGRDSAGQPFKRSIVELLDRHGDLYVEALTACFASQLNALRAG